ncbi:Transcription factor iws1 [Tilletia horrida]|uniref:Transcription factor iws1 n=1 Tax=Tilletia horrida TaxID=155126 RepID=A0AAN6JT27_9BASI|nr:Transcription factor iws1 [Tilletia horrida]KAK0567475.1 Transcription factor iws1 [Tilletia horrida]
MSSDALGVSGVTESEASISAVNDEVLASAAAMSQEEGGQDSTNVVTSEQEEELDDGARILEQANVEEAASAESSRLAAAAQQDPAEEDENAGKPSSSQNAAAADDEEGGDDDFLEEDPEVGARERAQIAAELAELGDDDDNEMRYRPHAILDDDDEDEVEFHERSRKKKKVNHTRSAAENSNAELDDGVPILTDKERRLLELNKKIDQALKAGKKKRGRKADNVDDIDILADESVKQLKIEMLEAAQRDEDANLTKGLVIEKLKLLPKVLATLQKTTFQQAITDENLLEGVKRWLEPLPDHSLPALNIQRSFFAALEKMQIDSISLKMSGLGKIMMFYSMNSKVDPAIRRSADRLIDIWSRPIIRKSASFRDRSVQQADGESSGVQYMASQSQYASSSQEIPQPGPARVRVPQAVTSFSVAPRSSMPMSGSGDGVAQTRIKNAAKLRTFKSKLKDRKQR